MSIDTLLEAARYLEWQAQQQQIAREEEQRREKELLIKEESRCVEVVTSSLAQPIRANHVSWGDDSRRYQQHPSPAPPAPASLPPPQVSIAVLPMVPVVTATPSVPPLPLATSIAAAATTLNGSLPVKTGSPPPQQHPFPCHLLCTAQIKVESDSPPIGGNPSQSQPQVQIPYPTSIGTTPCQHSTQHALLAQQASPASQLRPNGMAVDDMRGLDGRRRPGGAGTREVHNKLEKNRRAHLKECFETLKKNVPNVDEKKTSNLSVLRSALRYIQSLKRKEKEYEHEMERLAREKIATQHRLAELKNELSQRMDVMEIDRVLRQTVQPEDDQVSTSTASEGEDNLDQDVDEDMSPPPPTPSLPKATPPILQAQPLLAPHLSIQHTALPISGFLTTSSPSGPPTPQTIAPAPTPQTIAPASVPPPQTIAPAPVPPRQTIAPAPPPQTIAPAPVPPPQTIAPAPVPPPQTIAPAPAPTAHPLQPPAVQVQPTVIAHAAISHPSVIQAVNHALPANHKHLTHIAPSPGPASSTPQPIAAAAAHQPITAQSIGHITVHSVAHLGGPLPSHLPGLYPQGVSVSQPTMVGHITHTFTHHALPHVQANPHANANGAAVVSQGSPSLGKPTAVLAPHPQLVGQTAVLNPVTMVTVPPFPVSTLKLA